VLSKSRIIQLLEEGSFSELIEASRNGRSIFRPLLSLTYDKDSLLCWRAIEAIGIVTGRLTKGDVAETRSLVQRLLWMMRDESGNNVGSAPEILGEIVRNSPEQFSDIVPILASFHDEAGLRRGVFRALERIAEVRPDLCAPAAAPRIGEYIGSEDEYVRAYSILLVGTIGLKEFAPSVEALLDDSSAVTIYRQDKLQSHTVGKIAEETLMTLGKGGEK
jgi:hypothetical protein